MRLFSWIFIACVSFGTLCSCSGSCEGAEICSVDEDDASFLQVSDSRLQKLSAHNHDSLKVVGEPSTEHYWLKRGHSPTVLGATPWTAPADFSSGPAWVWNNSLDEQIRHSPLIDKDKNIYVTSNRRIRKFNSDGDLVWTWTSDHDGGTMGYSPTLHKGSIITQSYAPDKEGVPRVATAVVYSVSLADASTNWKETVKRKNCHCDSGTLTVYDDTLFTSAADGNNTAGNSVLYAMNASTGAFLWDYEAGDPFWNFSPTTPGDGTLLMSSNCGVLTRIKFDGELVYKKGGSMGLHPESQCGTGGGSMGPNGMFYAEYDDPTKRGAHIDAYNVSDGSLVWSKTFSNSKDQGWQYPAVGKMSDGRLAVVAAVGMITSPPPSGYINTLSKPLPDNSTWLGNAVVAMDAFTGEELWRLDEKPWPHVEALGDEMGVKRASEGYSDTICLPDIQGIPLISGDGTVYTSSSHNGDLRSIKDTSSSKDGKLRTIKDTDVSLFKTSKAFLNSPSLAKDMLVVAPCFGPMYVFKK